MLVCSQCQFQNPATHRFCQKCGAPLGAIAAEPASASGGGGLGADMQWLAVLCLSPSNPSPSNAGEELPIPSSVSLEAGQYLDPGDRYQLLEPLPDVSATVASTLEINVRVIDRRPNQPSYFEQIEQAEDEAPDALPAPGNCPTTLTNVPEIAEIYLTLQDELYPAMPQLWDAWVQSFASRTMNVVVLEDRSHLPTLLHCMKNEDILPFQVLMWIYDMTKLWQTLEPQGQCASLLEISNLVVDENNILCLQRLHSDYPGHAPSLKELGQVWNSLFQQSQCTQVGAIAQLCADLECGHIESFDHLQELLEAIALELQEPDLSGDDLPFANTDPLPDTHPSPESSMTEPLPPSGPVADESFDPPTLPPDTTPPAIPATDEPLEVSAVAENEDNDDLPTIVLPMKLISLEDAGRTDIGQQRKHNEDYFSIRTNIQKIDSPTGRKLYAKGLYVLCDGMGGHAGGEVASALAVETIEKYFETHWLDQLPSEHMLREAVYAANQAIYDLNQKNLRSGSGRMGTTLVVVLIQGTEAAIAHVGDSRLYRFTRRMGLEQLTVDHEVGQREIQRGVEAAIAYARPDAYQLTQALGPRDQNFVDPDIAFIELTEDSLFLLCSDGLTDDNLLEKHWRTHVEPLLSSQTNLEQGLVQLIDLANHYNGHDNITSVVIRAKVRPDVGPSKRL